MKKKNDCELCSFELSRRSLLTSTGALAGLAGISALGGGAAAWAQGAPTGIPHIILFEHSGFRGLHRHVFGREANLNVREDFLLNDRTSSIVVLEGNWLLYRDFNFAGRYPPILGPGLYPTLPLDVVNDDLSSLQSTFAAATVLGAPIQGHVILFEHANFHGRHKHLFQAEPNLNAGEDSALNDRVSSIAVLAGNWFFAQDFNFRFPYQPVLGPSLYPFVESFGIRDNDITSASPTTRGPTILGEVQRGEVILFQSPGLRGEHKHVLRAERNLNADDDRLFNDQVSSVAVLRGLWSFYRNSDFNTPYSRVLGVGTYPSLPAFGIVDNDMSSLMPV